jgi:hypothetical protein
MLELLMCIVRFKVANPTFTSEIFFFIPTIAIPYGLLLHVSKYDYIPYGSVLPRLYD